MKIITSLCILLALFGCSSTASKKQNTATSDVDFVLTNDQTHNKFSRNIPYVVKVPSGSIIEAFTHEATGGQLNVNSTAEDFNHVDLDKVHTLTGPVYVNEAKVGDILAIDLLKLELGEWGWTGMSPHFGFLGKENKLTVLKTFRFDKKTI